MDDMDSLIITSFEAKELEAKRGTKAVLLLDVGLPVVKWQPFLDPSPLCSLIGVHLLGSTIKLAEFEKGYLSSEVEDNLSMHGLENAFTTIFRLKPEAPFCYELALLLAIERLFDIRVPERIGQERAWLLELARITHHLEVLRDIFFCLENDKAIALLTDILLQLEPAHRLHQSALSPSKPLELSRLATILEDVLVLINELEILAIGDDRLKNRLSKKARFKAQEAAALGLTGLFLRAAMEDFDARKKHLPRLIYKTRPKPCILEDGDAYSRTILRILETTSSLEWLQEEMAKNRTAHDLGGLKIPNCSDLERRIDFAFSEIESPEGLLKVGIFFDKQLDRYMFRLRVPAYLIAQIIPRILLQQCITDLPLLLFSLGIKATEYDL